MSVLKDKESLISILYTCTGFLLFRMALVSVLVMNKSVGILNILHLSHFVLLILNKIVEAMKFFPENP